MTKNIADNTKMAFLVLAGAVGAVMIAFLTVPFGFWVPVALLLLVGAYYAFRSTKALFFTALVLVVFGQVARIPPGGSGGDFLLLDVVTGLFFGAWLLWWLIERKFTFYTMAIVAWIGFLLIAAISLFGNPLGLARSDILRNGFYLFRLVAYSSVVWIVPTLFQGKENAERLKKWLINIGMALVLIGFLQLRVFPNIGILSRFGWDPHVGRLVSTFLDPNFLGGFFAVLLAIVLGTSRQEGKKFPWLYTLLILVATILTYSRSGYLAVGVTVLVFGLLYSRRLLLVAILCTVPFVLFVPRISQRVQGGFSVDATAADRIASWKNAIVISSRYPLLGVGYNSYGQAQTLLGLAPWNNSSRASAGSDSSLLNIYATTGWIGITLFFTAILLFLNDCFNKLNRGLQKSPQAGAALSVLLLTPGLFVSAFFVNAYFYPFIFLVVATLLGIVYIPDSRTKN